MFGQTKTIAFSSDVFYVGIAVSSWSETKTATLKCSGLVFSHMIGMGIGSVGIKGSSTEDVETGEIEVIGSGKGEIDSMRLPQANQISCDSHILGSSFLL